MFGLMELNESSWRRLNRRHVKPILLISIRFFSATENKKVNKFVFSWKTLRETTIKCIIGKLLFEDAGNNKKSFLLIFPTLYNVRETQKLQSNILTTHDDAN